ncbi:MAG TPA: recombinase family protein [Thermoanaerobaculia bacterium]|nr:recombinase family protein [Thermoanaerobaculia bacterium]
MKQCFAYIRVSHPKQEEASASFTEQHSAISRYAKREGLDIIEWFQEVQTAAKRGRPVFAKVVKLLRGGKAQGLIMHKIDRSSRNYYDWAEISELADGGVSIHFANENLELGSRGRRLMADIQAVFATDYIRNLREEIHKGINGRLTEGLLPWAAPLGYINPGRGGKKKTICPVKGPLVRQAFELYGSGRYTLRTLCDELYRRGLRNQRGGRLTVSGLATLLNNPFFIGLMLYKKRGELHKGAHEALIPKALFDRVQRRLHDKAQQAIKKHVFIYRRMFRCARCGFSLIGERQKGHAYYRCHSCSRTCVREEALEGAIREALASLRISPEQRKSFDAAVTDLVGEHEGKEEEVREALKRELTSLQTRQDRLVDAYLEGALDKETFESRKTRLLFERRDLEERLADDTSAAEYGQRLSEILELASTALLSHEMATGEERREHLEILTSNRKVEDKNVEVELAFPFSLLAHLPKIQSGARKRVRSRSGTNLPEASGARSRDSSRSGTNLPESADTPPLAHPVSGPRHILEEIYDWIRKNPEVPTSVLGTSRDC